MVKVKMINMFSIPAMTPRIRRRRSRAFDSFSKNLKNSMGCVNHSQDSLGYEEYDPSGRLVGPGFSTRKVLAVRRLSARFSKRLSRFLPSWPKGEETVRNSD